MTCKYCGAEIKDGAKFCGECGAKVESVTEEFTKSLKDEDTSEEKDGLFSYISEDSDNGPERLKEDEVEVEKPTRDNINTADREAEAPRSLDAAPTAQSGNGSIGFSIASMVCGILSILCCCAGLISFVLGAAGIGLGIYALNKDCEGRGMAIAGIVCGGVGLLCTIGVTGVTMASLGSVGGLDSITDILESL